MTTPIASAVNTTTKSGASTDHSGEATPNGSRVTVTGPRLATANTIAKLAHGLTDDVVSLVACALPSTTPLLIAPAMNADMWANGIVQKNIATLDALDNVTLIGPDSGWQACRTEGAGRMSEPEAILEAAQQAF